MTDLDTYKFSCGHQFSMLKTENNGNLKQRTAWVCKSPQALPDACYECREAQREADEKKKESFNQSEASIQAHKALIDFLEIQIKGPAAQKDPALKLSFQKCFQDALNKQAALVKESLLKSTWLDSQVPESVPFENRLKVLHERLQVIEHSAFFNYDVEISREEKLRHCAEYRGWHKVKQDLTKLQGDYKQFSNGGFEKSSSKFWTRLQSSPNNRGAICCWHLRYG